MANHIVQIYPGDSLIVEVPEVERLDEFDQINEIVYGSSGLEVLTEKGRHVWMGYTDEIGFLIDDILRKSGQDKFYELKWRD